MRTRIGKPIVAALATAGLLAISIGSAVLAQGATRPAGSERVIQVVAKRFLYSPNEIVMKKGEAVVLEFTALDFTHGFKIPELNIRADLPPGVKTQVRVAPEKEGVYDFLCDNFCGGGHEEMSGRIVVTGASSAH